MTYNPIGIIPQQTNINQNTYFFLTANASSINVNSISSGQITAGFISSQEAFINDIDCLGISTSAIDLDGQTLTATSSNLLLNGVPIATASNLSSIADWSLEPAISDVNMSGFNLLSTNLVSTNTIRGTNAFFQNLIAINTMFVSSHISSISSSEVYIDELAVSTASINQLDVSTTFIDQGVVSSLMISTLNGYDISSIINPIPNISSVNTSSITASSINANNIDTNGLTVSLINNQPYISGSNWSQYPAVSVIDLAHNQIYNASVINAPGNLFFNTPDGLISSVSEDLEMTVDEGMNITTNATITMRAVNGLKGEINITADTGYANNGGTVNIQANGGVTPLGVAYGGEVNITATTGTFTSLAFTSAVNLNAAGINSYAGTTLPIGSLAGGNFIHGDSLVNITAGIPPIFSDPLCVYIRGTNGVLVDSTSYIQRIRPYSDLVQNPVDLYIEDYSNLLSHGYIQLRGVSTQTFAGGDTAILGVNKIYFSSAGGEVIGVSSINGIPIGAYENISSISSLNEWALYPALSSINANGFDLLNINSASFTGGQVLNVSSINGIPISEYQNTSTISTFQELFTSSLIASTIVSGLVSTSMLHTTYFITSTLNIGVFTSMSTAVTGVLEANSISSSTLATNTLTSDTASISSLTVSSLTGLPLNVNDWANYPAVSSITFSPTTPAVIQASPGNNIAMSGTNIQLIGAYTDAKNLLLVSSISTGTILGANDNLFGVGVQGLQIEANNIFLSSPNVTHPGTFNGNQILSIYSQSVTTSISSLTVSSINNKAPAFQDDINSFSSITTSTLFSPYIVTDKLFVSTQISGDIVASDSTKNIISSFSSIQTAGALFNNLNAGLISSGKITASSITLNSGVYSTIMVPQPTTNPGVGTSTMLTVNTDLNLGTNDLYAQQVRLGKGQLDNYAEILLYGNDGSTRNILGGTADRTIRVASSVAPTGPGYVLDTALNPPFFSTINQSTAMMSYFPSSIANTIGVSTISFMPPKAVAGTFISLSTQNITANTPLALWNEITDFTTGGLTTSTTAIVIPSNGIYEITTSIQFTKAGGSGISDWWFRLNGTDLTNSASEIYLPPGGSGQALGNITLSRRFTSGDKIEIMVASPDNGVSATFLQSTITPYVRPAVPSVITSCKCLNY